MTTAKKPARHHTVLLALALMIVGCTSESQTTTTPDAAHRALDRAGIPWIPCDDCAPILAPDGSFKAGRYVVNGPGFPGEDRAGGWPETVIVTFPGGWDITSRQRGAGISTRGLANARLDMGGVANVVVNPCTPDANHDFATPELLRNPPVGPTVGELSVALASIPGVAATGSTDVTLAGFGGIKMTLTILEDRPACRFFQLWATTPSAGETWGVSTSPGWHHMLWILDVDGLRFVIDASYAPDATVEMRAELLQIVNSIEIQP